MTLKIRVESLLVANIPICSYKISKKQEDIFSSRVHVKEPLVVSTGSE